MSTNCRRSSSCASSIAAAVHRAVGAGVAQSKLRCHSPERVPPVHVVVRGRMRVSALGGVLHSTSVSARRAMLRRRVRTLKTRVSYAVRSSGAYSVRAGFCGYVWVGHALFRTDTSGWELLDVVGACTVDVSYTSTAGVPELFHFAYNSAVSSVGCARVGVCTRVRVRPFRACLRVCRDLHYALVDHWTPNQKLIYARCDPDDAEQNMVGFVRTDNTIGCVTCGATFGTSTRKLSEHLNVGVRGMRFEVVHEAPA